MEGRDRQWRGSPLDVSEGTMDPYGIKEIVIEFDNGDSFVFRPRITEEFGSYELHMMAVGLDTAANEARRNVT